MVRRIALKAAGVPLSALLSEPEGTAPRATVVAIHGAGMSAGYFHGQAHPDVSLLVLGARLGFSVLAVDRPGYGASAATHPEGQSLKEQSVTLVDALRSFRVEQHAGDGIFFLAHSFGGKVALAAAGEIGSGLLGMEISGCGHEYAADGGTEAELFGPGSWAKNWGILSLYPPGTFRCSEEIIAAVPERELAERYRWPSIFSEVAAGVQVPVRFTFAEHESWWSHDERSITDLRSRFTAAPQIIVDRMPDSGHNISLGWTARAYHLRALGFFEECLAARRRTG
jgi:pimeloyl-ACP methyl ester carboxylesterase